MSNFSTNRLVNQTNGAAKGISQPLAGAILMSVAGALVVGASFYVIQYWPLPVSVAPVMGFAGGACWGLIVGAISGIVLGFLTDENHFS
jgi:hypothetical protein